MYKILLYYFYNKCVVDLIKMIWVFTVWYFLVENMLYAVLTKITKKEGNIVIIYLSHLLKYLVPIHIFMMKYPMYNIIW